MRKLFLDDKRPAWDSTWHEVRDIHEFSAYITEHMPDVISFDHDLEPQHYWGDYIDGNTGLECAKWLTKHCIVNDLDLPEIRIHSASEAGAKRISNHFLDYGLMYLAEEILVHPVPYDQSH